MSKIVIVSHTHLCRNPRVYKEAKALDRAGYEVKILTAIYSDDLAEEDAMLLIGTSVKYSFYSDLRLSSYRALTDRLIRKAASYILKKWGIESKYTLGYGASRLAEICKKEKADLYIMHQELPTVVGAQLLEKNFPVAFDIEDFYSEDLLPSARQSRPIKLLKFAESMALNKGIYTLTTSDALSDHLYQEYKGKKAFTIRNVFAVEDVLPRFEDHLVKRLYWFSQTIGPGRGLELLISSANLIETPLEIHLRGNEVPGFIAELNSQLEPKHSLKVHPLLENDKLTKDMCNYDIGLALEPLEPLNKLLTTSNKLFHYLCGGLPVVISPTIGQKEIMEMQSEKCIFSFDSMTASALASTIQSILSSDILKLKQVAFELACEKFNWEIEEKKLLKIVNNSV
ncbi:hypothetical protein [Desertivirga arenae]|uniref:hypothetical protein n=1 Tax=Desertivirga arenae TaxID=2810309 RepID=UPI001A96986A|nr:hypothetical protein [Pedobacter sp. SYSU D00823]